MKLWNNQISALPSRLLLFPLVGRIWDFIASTSLRFFTTFRSFDSVSSTLTMLGISADDIFLICFLIFPNKQVLTSEISNRVFWEKSETCHQFVVYWISQESGKTLIIAVFFIGTARSENVPSDMCAQRRFRSACAFAQSHQNLPKAHFG